MLWCSLIEIDALLSIIVIIMYSLYSLKANPLGSILLNDVYLFCRLFPLLFVTGFAIDSGFDLSFVTLTALRATAFNSLVSFDMLLALLIFGIMFSFKSLESVLLLLFAFISQVYMLHSVDLLSFYIALEAQNFCFLVLCGLPTYNTLNSYSTGSSNHSFSVEASLKYFLLSAFSSGVILFWFSILYLQTGTSSIQALVLDDCFNGCGTHNIYSYQILCAMMFKLGAAPLHLWVVQIYNGVKRQLLMYISTAPKLALFGFWINSFHGVWTDYSLLLFSLFSLILGSFGAYSQPGLRSLFAYSTVTEIGLMLSALEVAGFHNLMQHLGIYIITQFLLWNIEDKRLFSVIAVSLAGLPPLAGFFGKAWILWGLSTVASGSNSLSLYVLLLVALFCAAVSLVYYLRVLRLFFNVSPVRDMSTPQSNNSVYVNTRLVQYNNARVIPVIRNTDIPGFVDYDSRVFLTSTCAIALFIIPLFLLKPFVL